MALSFFASCAKDMATGVFVWVSGTYKLQLLTTAYTFSSAHDFRDDLGANEVSGTNYTAGGLTIANKTASAANPCVMTADDIVVAQSGGGFANGLKYTVAKITGGAASTDPLVAYGLAAGTYGNVAGALTLDIPASFLTITV